MPHKLWVSITLLPVSNKLSGGDFRGQCTKDSVIIYDGPDGNGLLETYCGRNRRNGFTKPDVSSSANEMTVVFKSNENNIVDTGFDVAFTAEPLPQEDDHWNSIVDQFVYLFEMDGIKLEFTKDAFKAIAKEAKSSASGARAIRSIFEDILQDSMFNLPSENNVEKIVIDKNIVEKREQPIQLLNKKVAN